jgi:hypothetical protein
VEPDQIDEIGVDSGDGCTAGIVKLAAGRLVVLLDPVAVCAGLAPAAA